MQKKEKKAYRQKSTLLLKKLINIYMVLPTYLSFGNRSNVFTIPTTQAVSTKQGVASTEINKFRS
jgi:hypothetical protein